MEKGQQKKIPKLALSVKKPENMILDRFDIFTQTYFGKLTNIVEHFESYASSENVLNIMATRDERGNTPFDIACYLGYKNIVLYFLKCGVDPTSLDNKKRNSFHYLLARREYATMMIVVNFLKHQTKEELFRNVKHLKRMFGFKHSEVKHGELTGMGFQNEETLERFQEFITSMERLCVHTFQEYLKFYRMVLNQQDFNGRNPIHYAKYEKAVMDVLNINLDSEDGFEEFKQECTQLQSLEDPNSPPLEPRKYFHAFNELKHFLAPEVYDTIYKDYLRERRLLLRDIVNARDVCEETPLHIASRRGDYLLVSHFLKLGAQVNRNVNGKTSLDLAKDKFTRKALTSLHEEAFK